MGTWQNLKFSRTCSSSPSYIIVIHRGIFTATITGPLVKWLRHGLPYKYRMRCTYLKEKNNRYPCIRNYIMYVLNGRNLSLTTYKALENSILLQKRSHKEEVSSSSWQVYQRKSRARVSAKRMPTSLCNNHQAPCIICKLLN